MLSARNSNPSPQDNQAAVAISMLKIKAQAFINNDAQYASSSLTADKIDQFKTCIALLKDTFSQLKSAGRPALELASCQYQLADLYVLCPHTYNHAYNNNQGRIINGLSHCANTIAHAKNVDDPDMKNNLIINSIVKITHLLGENQAASAIDQLDTEKKKLFLTTLNGHISAGLKNLSISDNLSAEGKQTIVNATQPLLNAINNILYPQTRFSLFKSPLTLLGAAAGLGLALYTGSYFDMLALPLLWGAAGSKTGETVDKLAENCKRTQPAK